jgi:hypothetical protein
VPAGVADQGSVAPEVVTVEEVVGLDRPESLDVHPVGNHLDGGVHADLVQEVVFGRRARREYRVGPAEEPAFVGLRRPSDHCCDGVGRRDVRGVLAGRRVVRRHQREVAGAGEPKPAESEAERRVGVDDLRAPDRVGNSGRAEPEAVVERKREAPDRVFAVRRGVAVRARVHHVHLTARPFPALAPRGDSVGHAVDRRKVRVRERRDLFH